MMNKYTQMYTIEKLVRAEALLKKISKDGSYAKIFTIEEFVALDLAILDAKKILEEDILARVTN